MRMFKCDICGTPFVYSNKQQCNYISFRNIDLDHHQNQLTSKSIGLFNSYDKKYPSATYEICPSCFDKIRDFLWSLSDRKVSEK